MGSCSKIKFDSKFNNIANNHSCFNEKTNFKYYRIHLPVSPACNIHCKFCTNCFDKHHLAKRAANTVLTPEEALEAVDRALEIQNDIKVVGISGPGDTLATSHALETFELIHEKYPHLINCLSTNGLMLKENAERIANAGVKTVILNINAVQADILQKICSYIIYDGQYMEGKEAALWLLLAQLAGIKKVSDLGITVKINTVLIPGVNDGHVSEIARVTSGVGASLIDIMPLTPENGTRSFRPPDCSELIAARNAAGEYLTVFTDCQQCMGSVGSVSRKDIDLWNLLYEKNVELFDMGDMQTLYRA